jgi:hypothetical protein
VVPPAMMAAALEQRIVAGYENWTHRDEFPILTCCEGCGDVDVRASVRDFSLMSDTDTEFVKVYDFTTGQTTMMPAVELAPGMVRIRVEGSSEIVWADSSQLKQGEYRHPPFSGEMQQQIQHVRNSLAEVFPKSYEEWEDDFRRDVSVEREIGIWLRVCACLEEFGKRHQLSGEERKDAFRLLVACFNSTPTTVFGTVSLRVLDRGRAQELVDLFFPGLESGRDGRSGGIHLRFRYEEKDYVRALRALYAQRLRVRLDAAVAGLVGGLGAWLWQFPDKRWLAILFLVLAAIMVAMLIVAFKVMPSLIFRRDPRFRDEYGLTFMDEEIHFRTAQIDSRLKWEMYTNALLTAHSYLLFYGKQQFTVVPKRVFESAGQQQEFEEMLSRHIGEIVRKD